MVERSLLVMAWRMFELRLGWAARVVAMVLGDIGGSGLLTGLTGRGIWFLAGVLLLLVQSNSKLKEKN